MKHISLYFLAILFLLGCGNKHNVQNETVPQVRETLSQAREGFETNLVHKYQIGEEVESPPADIFKIVRYKSSVGDLSAYLSVPSEHKKKQPAIIWVIGGFDNSIGATAWEPSSPDNDQSARAFRNEGIVTMCLSLRGGNNNPGYIEGFYGEVDDIISAYDYLAKQDYVDPSRIYLGGHSTGGTLVLLVAESTDKFRAIFSLGPVADIKDYGAGNFKFDVNDTKEWRLRSPIYYLESIATLTYVFEGTERGMIDSLRDMRRVNRNDNVMFHEIHRADHFNIIVPITKMLADKIKLDITPNTKMTFSKKELSID